MNPDIQKIESELESLELRPCSKDLRQQIALDISTLQKPQKPKHLKFFMAGVAASVCAACVLVAALYLPKRDSHNIAQQQETKLIEDVAMFPPTLDGYNKALALGPEALDQLLDHHAKILLTPKTNVTRVCDFNRFELNGS